MTVLRPHEAALIEAAWKAREGAVCQYSQFKVGAVFVDADGQYHGGANVENASYNLGLCAERVALYHALTHGARGFTLLAITTEAPEPTYPCGACRQALWEFARDAEVFLVNRDRHIRTAVRDLLPHAFDGDALPPPKTR